MASEPTVARVRQIVAVQRGVVRTPARPEALEIGLDPLLVGRDPGAHLSLDDREVSAIHCELRAEREGILVRDVGSTNGTWVGPVRVREILVSTPLEITLGRSRITVEPTGRAPVELDAPERFHGLTGGSPAMRRLFGVLEKVAPTELSVLILGETGTGKELVARALHDASPRRGGPFVAVDCASIPPTLAESVLFGHEKGAFTGAVARKQGALADADGGTLFLDELGELLPELQAKLLRTLAERQVRRIGASAAERLDVRLVAATRRDLNAEINAGRFRSDLYFRIAQVRLELPPLRERAADLGALVTAICERSGQASAAPLVLDWIGRRLGGYDWPGNVRELVNVTSVAAALAATPDAIDDVLPLARSFTSPDTASEPRGSFSEAKRGAIARFESAYWGELSSRTGGNVSQMAREAGVERHHVRAFLRKYNIER